ncbi:hypothetical protein BDF22DRAFT_700270 [Syncephalis plumigaleata]|nr:hypothetical protein BDF22DRAFT_700270 [Syncephalis plumigaleata]
MLTTMDTLPANCELLQLVQYKCEYLRHGVICRPIARYFERCLGKPTRELVPVHSGNMSSASAPASASSSFTASK